MKNKKINQRKIEEKERSHINIVEMKYKKYMCKDCINFIANSCEKLRIPEICARKNLKNK